MKFDNESKIIQRLTGDELFMTPRARELKELSKKYLDIMKFLEDLFEEYLSKYNKTITGYYSYNYDSGRWHILDDGSVEFTGRCDDTCMGNYMGIEDFSINIPVELLDERDIEKCLEYILEKEGNTNGTI